MHKKRVVKRFIFLAAVTALLFCAVSVSLLRRDANIEPVKPAEASAVTPHVAELAAEVTPMPVRYETGTGKARISEVMSRNKATLQDSSGEFPDWVEIENLTGETLDLEGWSLADGTYTWAFPACSLQSSGRIIVFCSGKESCEDELHASFAISEGDTVVLSDRNGDEVSSCYIEKDKTDWVLIPVNNGWELSEYPTPGYENSAFGYEAFCGKEVNKGPVVINEVCADNHTSFYENDWGYSDWVEIKNISAQSIDLSEFFMSDDHSQLQKYPLSGTLAPGELAVFLCDKDAEAYPGKMKIAPFSVNAENDRLYISSSDGEIVDFVSLKNIPYGGTYGRAAEKNGYCYLYWETPGEENSAGERRIAPKPSPSCPDGVYNGVEAVTVELSAPGDIYYTLDSSVPGAESALYTGPITLTETTVLRAINVEAGALASSAVTLTYVINEGHTLPVASLVSDDSVQFHNMYAAGRKNLELPGSLSFYEDGSSFTIGCGIKMNGFSSLNLRKKNLAVRFRGSYGSETLDYDLFGGGITSFTNLVLRAGQDQNNTLVRNEVCYTLASQLSESIVTERFKYCVLYLDGVYNGIYAIMEKPNEQHFASTEGVSKGSVEMIEGVVYSDNELYSEVISYAYTHDMKLEENYEHVAQYLDIDSFIDWCLVQGFCGNYDLKEGNLRYARSVKGSGKWRMVFFDLDCTFVNQDFCQYNVLSFDNQVSYFNKNMLESPIYKEKYLIRASEAFKTVLNKENLVAVIENLCSIVAPEIDRDKQFSNMDQEIWRGRIDNLESFLDERKWMESNINNLCRLTHATEEEREMYFGDIA